MILVSYKELATTDWKDIKFYDINTTKCLDILSAHEDKVNDLKLLNDG